MAAQFHHCNFFLLVSWEAHRRCHSVLSFPLQKLVVFADDTGYWPETIFYYNGTRAEPEATITLRAGEEGGASLPLCYPITFGGELLCLYMYIGGSSFVRPTYM